ncbi:hypothetical protein IW140_003395 [Coemansia sp. RSA 1813]|nr:hypothetical protein EV178_003213 [Coemansia sp. RSA 1646]KAJ1771020.1 hypothetical protein LPJ74_002711 [Coemansia sp. RSA 1843]KAJ2089259.1 hypothetical protein IW138_003579 [Coemansia sp. RSA 986]KAJ2215089.1 hypothetical protein EV179_002457 [Coemansia sp. RSA 487]KAJ2569030.1 hypothetical protein IW140_003395 [Coemansia sp. RSA 1813]
MAMFLSRKTRTNNKAQNSRRRAIDDLSCMACAPQNTFRFTDSQAMDVAMVLAEEYVRKADPCPFETKLLPIEPTSPEPSPQLSEPDFPSPSCMLSPRAAATLGLRTINEELATADCDATPLSSMIPPFPRPPRGNVFAAAPLPSPASTIRVPSNQQPPPAFLTEDRAFLSLPLRSTRTRMRARVPTTSTNTTRIVSSNSTVYGSDSFPAYGGKDATETGFSKRQSRFSLRAKHTLQSPSIKGPVRWIRRLFS